MSSQPTSGDQWTVVSGGVGTETVTDRQATVKRIVWGGTFVGTLNIHDSATAGGTTDSTQILSIGLPQTQYPFSLELNTKVSDGILYQATGTPEVTIVWD